MIFKKCVEPGCRASVQRHNSRCSRCAMRVWRKANPVKAVLAHLRDRSRRRKMPITITLEELTKWIADHKLSFEDRVGTYLAWTIDRIDCNKGYHLDNIQPLTMQDNIRKWISYDRHHLNEEKQNEKTQ